MKAMGSFGLWLTRGAQSLTVPPRSSQGDEESVKAASGSRVGVGLVMEADENSGNIFISDLVPNSAAWHSSLCVGDRITHIDGVPVRGKLAVAVNDLLLGAEGSVLELRVEARAAAEGGKVRCISHNHESTGLQHFIQKSVTARRWRAFASPRGVRSSRRCA